MVGRILRYPRDFLSLGVHAQRSPLDCEYDGFFSHDQVMLYGTVGPKMR